MKPKQQARLVLLATLAMLAGGCVTSKVWEQGQFARYHDPASPAGLQLFHSSHRQDVLVEYLETRESDGATQRRAYWLDRETTRVEARHKPRFVPLDEAQGLEPIPVLDSGPVPGAPSSGGLYAVVATNGTSFTLYSPEKALGSFDLPVYRDASGRVKQVLLTPPALAVDLTIVGGVVAIAVAPSLWTSLNCVVH